MELTREDVRAKSTLEDKTDLIRSGVKGVTEGYDTGLFIWGEGGTSKSHTVMDELERLKIKPVLHNSRLTGRGLVDALEEFPEEVHLIEDAETLLLDKNAHGVLRSALWSQSKARPRIRYVTWQAHKTRIRFEFSGGVIVISNENLCETIPAIRAIKTRINVLHFAVSHQEIIALMKHICFEGYVFGDEILTPDECWEVAEFIIGKSKKLGKPLDLRLLNNGFGDMLKWKAGIAGYHWQVLLDGRMRAKADVLYKPRAVKIHDERQVAMAIHDQGGSTEEKVQRWYEATGKSQAAFYRRLQMR